MELVGNKKWIHVWDLVLAGNTIHVEFEILPSGELGTYWIDPKTEDHSRLYGWTPSKIAELSSAYRHGYLEGIRKGRREKVDGTETSVPEMRRDADARDPGGE